MNADTGGSSRLSTLITLSTAIAIVPYDYISINLATPRLREALAFAPEVLPWILGGYVLVFGSCLVLAGRLGDFYGRRRMMLLGLMIFGVCSAVTALANGPAVFLAARLIKGTGSALLSANALALINVLHPEGRRRNRSYGVATFVMGVFAVLFMSSAGFLLSHSWRYLLLLNVPLTAVLFAVTLTRVPESIGRGGSARFDYGGAVLSIAAFGTLSLAIANGFRLGITSPLPLLFLAVSMLSFALLGRIEASHPQPILPLRLLRQRNLVGAYLVCFFWSAGNTSYPIPIFIQEVLGYGMKQASLALLPTIVIGSVVALFTARLLQFISLRLVLILALLFEAAGIGGYALLTPGSTYLGAFLPSALACSMGFLATWIAVRLIAVGGVDPEDQGVASGSIFAMQQLGNSVGIPGLAAIFNLAKASQGGTGLAASLFGYRLVFLSCISLLAIALVPAIVLIRARGKSAGMRHASPRSLPPLEAASTPNPTG